MLRLKKSLTSLRNWGAQQDDPAPPVPVLNLEDFSDWQVVDGDEEEETTAVDQQAPSPSSPRNSDEGSPSAMGEDDSTSSLKDSMFSRTASGDDIKLKTGTELAEFLPSTVENIRDVDGFTIPKKPMPSAISLRNLIDDLRVSSPSLHPTLSSAERTISALGTKSSALPKSSAQTTSEPSQTPTSKAGLSSQLSNFYPEEYRHLDIDDCRDLRYNPEYHECMCIAHQVERSDKADWDAIFAAKPEPIDHLKSELEDEDGFVEIDSDVITIHLHGQEVQSKTWYGITCDGTCPSTCPNYQHGLVAGLGRIGKGVQEGVEDVIGGGIF